MDCGQGKNMSDEGGAGVDVAVGVGVDVARKKDGEQTSAGEDDAKGNDSAEDIQKAIAGINYLVAGAPHPINKPLRLRTCESIPPPPHEATPPINKPLRLRTCKSIPPPPHGATPPSGGSKSVGFATPPPYGATPPLAFEGLQPPILEQTGGLLTGAKTDKLRLQNRWRCHALQEKQVPTTLWSTHTGHTSLPPQ